MKRMIKASDEQAVTKEQFLQLLQSKGIDTTPAKYEFKYIFYGRFGDDEKKVLKFTAPGDYVASLALAMHEVPSIDNITDYFGWTIEDLESDLVDEYPTTQDILDTYGWHEEFDNIDLKNLTTNTTLYEGEVSDNYDEEDYGEDW